MGKRTAVLELSEKRGFRWLKDEKKSIVRDNMVRYMDVDYYSDMSKSQIPMIMNMNYDFVILDIGTNILEFKEQYLTSERKIMLCSLQKWKKKEAELMLERFQNPSWGYIQPDFYSAFYTLEEKEKFEHLSGTRVGQLPWVTDPFHLAIYQIPTLRQMLAS